MRAIAERWVPVAVVSNTGGYERQLIDAEGVEFVSLPHWGRSRMTLLPRGLAKQLRRGDLVYLHEGWTPSNAWAAIVCTAKKIPFVVMPHGVYDPAIVDGLRFRRARISLERWVLRQAYAVHVFFESEADDISRIFGSVRCVSVTTGWELPGPRSDSDACDPEPFLSWMGRYDVKHKGIDRLLKSLATLPPSQRPYLRMRGDDHRGGKGEVVSMVEALSLQSHVEVGSSLDATEIGAFLRSSRGSVHVPRWEAFGRSILDAIESEVPVLLSREPRIAGALAEANAALVIDADDVGALAAALAEFFYSPPRTADAATEWVGSQLSWGSRVERLRCALGVAQRQE